MNITTNAERAGEIITAFLKVYPHNKQTPNNVIHLYNDYHNKQKIGQVTIEDEIGKEEVIYRITITGKEVVKTALRKGLLT